MSILITILILCFFIGFVVAFPYIGLPVIFVITVVCILKRGKIKKWYDNLPVYEKPKKEKPQAQPISTTSQSFVEFSTFKRSGYSLSEYNPDLSPEEQGYERIK